MFIHFWHFIFNSNLLYLWCIAPAPFILDRMIHVLSFVNKENFDRIVSPNRYYNVWFKFNQILRQMLNSNWGGKSFQKTTSLKGKILSNSINLSWLSNLMKFYINWWCKYSKKEKENTQDTNVKSLEIYNLFKKIKWQTGSISLE